MGQPAAALSRAGAGKGPQAMADKDATVPEGDVLASLRGVLAEEAARGGAPRRDGVLRLTEAMRVAPPSAPFARPGPDRDAGDDADDDVLTLTEAMRVAASANITPPASMLLDPPAAAAKAPPPDPAPGDPPAIGAYDAPSPPDGPALVPPAEAPGARPLRAAPPPSAPPSPAASRATPKAAAPDAPPAPAPEAAAATADPRSIRAAFARDRTPAAPVAPVSDDALRALIRECIREELAGETGLHVSRNIRRMVRDEVQRIIAEIESDGPPAT